MANLLKCNIIIIMSCDEIQILKCFAKQVLHNSPIYIVYRKSGSVHNMAIVQSDLGNTKSDKNPLTHRNFTAQQMMAQKRKNMELVTHSRKCQKTLSSVNSSTRQCSARTAK